MSSRAEGSSGVTKEMKMDDFAKIFAEIPDDQVQVRTVLQKFKVSESLDTNTKELTSARADGLAATLTYLRGIGEDDSSKIEKTKISAIRKEGLIIGVLLEINKLITYECNSCSNKVINHRLEKPNVLCRGCGIGACPECFPSDVTGWSYLCPPCGNTVDNSNKIPEVHMKNTKGSKKKSSSNKATQARKNAVPQTIDEEVIMEDVGQDDSDDESNETFGLPLGQGSPPYQSTQAVEQEVSAVSFPELNFSEIPNTQGDDAGAGNTSGPGAGPVELSDTVTASASTSNEDVFIEPPKRLRADKKKQKQVSNQKEVRGSNPAQSQVAPSKDGEAPPVTCRFYMRGSCKFGFFGKGKGGQGKCPFYHPKPCRKLMENGSGERGCSKGRNCEAVHPRMCHQSLSTRSCNNIKDGARCTAGYHVKGTKVPSIKPLSSNDRSKVSGVNANKADHKKTKDTNQTWSSSSPPSVNQARHSAPTTGPPSMGDQQLDFSSVFGEIIRAEVIKLLQTGSLWPQRSSQQGGLAVSPPTSPPVLKGPDPTITMGSLGALLSLMGNQHQQ
jgi:hypothetical protein